MFSASAFAQ
ncbi:hypothetical protein VCHC39A1_0636, partial [Vibrio cholerae HC-39A1]